MLKRTICLSQYVGQTVDIFRKRWNNFKSNGRKYIVGELYMEKHIFEHFNNEGHTGFSENDSVTFIDKTKSQNPEKNNYWIHTLKNMVSWDLNILSNV